MEPNPFLEEQLRGVVSRNVAGYYLHCDPRTHPSPFTKYLTHAQRAADLVIESLDNVTNIVDVYYERKKVLKF